MERPASQKIRRNTEGWIRIVGPISNRKPPSSSTAALPPSHAFFSNTSTSYPRAASVHAAERPPNPEPITATRMVSSSPLFEPGGSPPKFAQATPARAPAAVSHLEIGGKELQVRGRCGLIGTKSTAALADDRLEHSHFQKPFTAASQAKSARFAAAKAHSWISRSDDYIVNQHGADREPGCQRLRISLRPKNRRGQCVWAGCMRCEGSLHIGHVKNRQNGRKNVRPRNLHVGVG